MGAAEKGSAYAVLVEQRVEGFDFSIVGAEKTGKTKSIVAAELRAVALFLDPESDPERVKVTLKSTPRL